MDGNQERYFTQELIKAINGVAFEISLVGKRLEKLERSIDKLNEAPIDVTVANPSQE